MLFTGDLARIGFWAALHLRGADLTCVFQGLVFCNALACGFTVRIRVVAPKLLERFTFGTDVLVVLWIPFKVRAGPCAICSFLHQPPIAKMLVAVRFAALLSNASLLSDVTAPRSSLLFYDHNRGQI